MPAGRERKHSSSCKFCFGPTGRLRRARGGRLPNLSFRLAQIFPLRRMSSCLDLRILFFAVGTSDTKVRSISFRFLCILLLLPRVLSLQDAERCERPVSLRRSEEISERYKGFDVEAQETPYRFGTFLISFLNVLGPV